MFRAGGKGKNKSKHLPPDVGLRLPWRVRLHETVFSGEEGRGKELAFPHQLFEGKREKSTLWVGKKEGERKGGVSLSTLWGERGKGKRWVSRSTFGSRKKRGGGGRGKRGETCLSPVSPRDPRERERPWGQILSATLTGGRRGEGRRKKEHKKL